MADRLSALVYSLAFASEELSRFSALQFLSAFDPAASCVRAWFAVEDWAYYLRVTQRGWCHASGHGTRGTSKKLLNSRHDGEENVRSGSQADVRTAKRHVRFAPIATAKVDIRKCHVRIAAKSERGALLDIAKKGRCERPFLCQQHDDIYR
jgi:hypothetical protein